MQLEIDVDNDILDFDPVPPRRQWLDYIPAFIVDFPRKLWGFPEATPREVWFVSLHFVKNTLLVLLERERARHAAPFMSMGSAKDVPPSELN